MIFILKVIMDVWIISLSNVSYRQIQDLNYGFVIIGKDLRFNPIKKEIYADKNFYFDKYGKFGASQEELNEYIKNIYYVLMTRGVKGTYLYIVDDELRKYLSNYISVMKVNNSFFYGNSDDSMLLVAEDSPKYGS